MKIPPIGHNAFATAQRVFGSLGLALLCAATATSFAADAPATSSLPTPTQSAATTLNAMVAQKSNEAEFLPPDVAFQLAATSDGPDRIQLTWQIADGYYLYRTRIKAATTSDRAQIGALVMPTGLVKQDDNFGRQEVYHHELKATLPVARPAGARFDLPIKVTYQGCAEAGLCYPPITKAFNVTMSAGSGSSAGGSGSIASAGGYGSVAATSGAPTTSGPAGFVSEQDRYASVIRDSNIVWVILSFLAAGVGLSFTPCVLPMVPIVSGIIIGDGTKAVTTKRSFTLSLVYVLGMALTYTAAGMAVAAGGQQVQAAFQQPWIIVLFSAVFVVLAVSMFGFFTLQMPAAIQTRLASVSNQQSAGTYGGVAVMGALSALIVTTCVAPALVGALLVIGQSGNLARGGAALFAMGIGMGTPLLVVGASAGKLLPRAGMWMDLVKKLFGALMLAVSAWMLGRIVPANIALLLWIVPTAAIAIVLWTGTKGLRKGVPFVRIAASAATVYAGLMIAGAIMGNTDPLSPLTRSAVTASRDLPFRTIKSLTDLQREVADAKSHGKSVLLDFYADWCTSCKEMERFTFPDASVRTALNGTVLLRADVTENNDDDKALLKHFGIFGPPTIAFYGIDGEERSRFRVVGFMKAAEFAPLARQALQAPAPAAAGAEAATTGAVSAATTVLASESTPTSVQDTQAPTT